MEGDSISYIVYDIWGWHSAESSLEMNFNCSPTCFRFNLITRHFPARPISLSYDCKMSNQKSRFPLKKKKLSLANSFNCSYLRISTLVSVSVSALWYDGIWSLVFSSRSLLINRAVVVVVVVVEKFHFSDWQINNLWHTSRETERERDTHVVYMLGQIKIYYTRYICLDISRTHSAARGPSPSPNQIHL